ncbi:MAG: hypothetical protein OXT51_08800 [Chloroflexota bacterium]|nr:hypothetical protein [Chloroflexota bacterium]MDE2970185.1 hypothetical protein [Chloroflexota bacterium]
MADMHDAFDIARAIDGRLALAGAAADDAVDAFREALYDYRGDGDLDAFLERCAALLAELGDGGPPVEGRCFRALDSVFSSG